MIANGTEVRWIRGRAVEHVQDGLRDVQIQVVERCRGEADHEVGVVVKFLCPLLDELLLAPDREVEEQEDAHEQKRERLDARPLLDVREVFQRALGCQQVQVKVKDAKVLEEAAQLRRPIEAV